MSYISEFYYGYMIFRVYLSVKVFFLFYDTIELPLRLEHEIDL